MKHKMTKCRMYLTIDREEIFLNEMCQKGWKPVGIMLGLWFKFERCEPGEYIARVTTGIDPKGRRASKERRRQIIEFLTDSGAEIVPETNVDAHTRIYAVRKAVLGEFEINTDTDSLITDYTARRKYHIWALILAFLMFPAGLMEGAFIGSISQSAGNVNETAAPQPVIVGIALEVFGILLVLVCIAALVIPIPAYTRKIRELREKRKFEE